MTPRQLTEHNLGFLSLKEAAQTRVSLDMQNATLLEITCHGSILVQRIMDYVQRLQIANLQLELDVI